MAFRDERACSESSQPYGELFAFRADGTGLRQLTDNQWEDGTPFCMPRGADTLGGQVATRR